MTTPTLETVRAAYIDAADYESEASVTQAKLFLTAARRLLVMLPASAVGKDRTQVDFELAHIREEIKACQSWLSSNPGSSGLSANPSVLHHDFSEFTDR
jgi:hypothetical protein